MKDNKTTVIKSRISNSEKEAFYASIHGKIDFSKAIRLFIQSVITKNKDLIKQFYN